MLRVSSSYNVKKSRFCRKSSSSKKRDEISALPDELIIHILSFLTPKEAAITSLLSRRWRNLWTFIPNLDLNIHHMPKRMRTRAFVRMVNNVLSSHNGQHINKFWICYELEDRSSRYIDKWISFAIERKVENLILDLTEDQDIDVEPGFYTFPCFFFSEEKALSSIKYLRLAGCILQLPPYFNNLKSLVELSLTYMEVTEDEIYKLLSSCLLLERLTVGHCPELVNFKVSGPSLVYLEVSDCRRLDNIEIWATNLVSLIYKGAMINFSLNCVPQLEHVVLDLDDSTFDYVANVCNHLAFNAPQLKSFELWTAPLEVNTSLTVVPRLVNLKVLTLLVPYYYDSVVGFWYLLKASPFLHLLKLNFLCRRKSPSKSRGCKNKFSGNGIAFTHEFLKEAHMTGVRSCSDDLEFARYLLKNATALNKLVIDPIIRHPCGWIEEENKATRKAREKAKRLIKEAPANVKLFIL